MTTDIRPPNDSADWEALARFFSGESPEPEAETIRRWLFEHPRESSALAALDGLVGRLDVQMPAETADVGAAGTRDPSVDDAWRRVAERLDEPVVLPLSAPRPAVRPLPRPAWRTGWRTGALRAAATVALVAAGSLVWRGTHGGDEGPAVAARTFSTPVGTRDSTVLADGSRVLLGPGSSLQTTEGYGGDRREVRLDGEALFEVRHDAARPFVVRAAGAVIRDLGTAFSVRSADSSGGTTVAVTQGSVLVARAGAPDSSGTVLRQGDVGAIAADGRVTARRGVVLDRELAWTRGRLVFRDTPLAEVAVALRRWYGVDVRFAEPLLSARHWTAEFDAGTSLADVLRVMELGIGGITVERSDSVVVIGTRASTGGMTR